MPVNDSIFQNMNAAQALWYVYQLEQDDIEQYEFFKNMEEYNAMFTNPEAVRKVREARENTVETTDAQFEKVLEHLEKESQNKFKNLENNIQDYLSIDLDEIKFYKE